MRFLEKKCWHGHGRFEGNAFEHCLICIGPKKPSKFRDKGFTGSRWNFEYIPTPMDHFTVSTADAIGVCLTIQVSPLKVGNGY